MREFSRVIIMYFNKSLGQTGEFVKLREFTLKICAISSYVKVIAKETKQILKSNLANDINAEIFRGKVLMSFTLKCI